MQMSTSSQHLLNQSHMTIGKQSQAYHLYMMSDLIRELEFYKLSLQKALRNNYALLQANQAIIPTVTPKEEQVTMVKHPSPVAEIPEVKQQISSLSQENGFENQGSCKKSYRKRKGQNQEDSDINETKNIPKNYGKAILSFIQRNIGTYRDLVSPILTQHNMSICDLLAFVKKHKRAVNSINYLKLIWGHKDEANPILKCVRILSLVFLRKYCLSYVFNSRVKNYMTHVKYRRRITEGLLKPEEFTCIKQF